jgi:hypothetical protein
MTKNATATPGEEDYWYPFAKAVSDCGHKGSKLLCELAQIPEACADRFCDEIGRVLATTYIGDHMILGRSKTVPPEIVTTVEKFEKAIREAYSIFLSLPEEWRHLFYFFEVRPGDWRSSGSLVSALQREEPWDSIFQRMIRKCTDYTGRRPMVTAKRGRGRRRGDSTKETYPLKNFVSKLACAVRRHGGRLTLNAKEQRGTWIDALNGLRPLFTEGFIPNALPLSMIEEVQAKANKFPLKSKFPRKSSG